MIWSYFKITFRNIYKRKTYAILNILGLAIGIAGFLLISLFITDELSYDRYHSKADRIYRLVNVYDFEGVGENSVSSPFPVAKALKNDNPELIDNIVRVFNFQAPRSFVEYEENRFNEKRFFFADSTFFEIFDHQFVAGNPTTALNEQFSVVITESAAKKYFGKMDPMGKVIKFEENMNLKISGIIKDVPEQSHFQFDFIASLSSVKQVFGGRYPNTWIWNPCWTYILLNENVRPEALEASFPGFIDKYFYDAEKDNISLYLQPLTDIHLKSHLDYEIEPNNSIISIYVLSALAIFILIIAIINYMNLSTATSSTRAKEVGIKKVTGAYRWQLFVQFIGESIIVSFMALLVALIFIEFLLPSFNNFTGKRILIHRLFEQGNLILLIGIGIFTGLISGFYPAVYLSGFNPISILKGSLRHGTKSGLSRKILVVLQFTISIVFIIGTTLIHDQLKYMRNADLGFNDRNILVVPINRTPIAREFKAFKGEILQNANIVSVTAMDDIFGSAHNTHEFRPEGLPEDQWQFYPAMVIRYDFLKTFDIKILAGRDYREENKTDPEKGILINEAMVKHMGWENNEAALGKKFSSLSGQERVIGVFNNFNVTSLHEKSGPFVFNIKETRGAIMFFMTYMAIRIVPGSEKDVLALVEKEWVKAAPNRPFEYFFLSDYLEGMYDDEDNLSGLSKLFTGIIIIIALMGLLGLSSFLAEQKTKEIGIRKVMGASLFNVVQTISKEFIWLIMISSLLAWIIAYFVMTDWLNRFAYQVPINWFVFVAAALIALGLALVITSLRAFIASRANPVDTLKYE
jgi:putative ABC transport system permease protein